MNNALWLLLALPVWYFSAAAVAFQERWLTLIPAAGALCLMIGVIGGILMRRSRLLYFATPLVFSELIVGFSGFFRGKFKESEANTILVSFLVFEFIILIFLVYRMKGYRLPAFSLAIFSLTYAVFAALIASMSFSDKWL